MAETIMKGKPVIDKLNEHLKSRAEALRARGAAPALAIVRVGDNGDDMAYERNAAKCCEAAGVEVRLIANSTRIRQFTAC